MEQNNKIISVMGSSGSGKTVTAAKLALELSRKKKNVIVVCCDPFVPVISYLLPADVHHEVSLGTLLTSHVLSQTDILKACVPVERNEYISILGYRTGESLMHFPKVTRDKAVEFFVLLRYLADFIIVDCSSAFEADLFSVIAIEMADQVFRLGTANLKGISYYKTHNTMLADSRFQKEKQKNVISNVKAGQEWEAVAQQYGGAPFLLPYLPELEQQYDELTLFSPLTGKEGAAYMTQLGKMLQTIFPMELENEKKQTEHRTEKKKENIGMKPEREKNRGKEGFGIKLSFGRQKGEF